MKSSEKIFYVSLHIGPPGNPKELLTNEATYPGYHKVQTTISRDWELICTLGNTLVRNKNLISFGTVQGVTTEKITHLAISNEANLIVDCGPISNEMELILNLQPMFQPGSIIIQNANYAMWQSDPDQLEYEEWCRSGMPGLLMPAENF